MSTPFVPVEYRQFYGLCTKPSRAAMPMGFSDFIHDVDLSVPGIARTRGGNIKFTASQLGYNAKRIFDYYIPLTKMHVFLGNGGTKVFKLVANGVKTEIGTGFDTGLVFDFVSLKNTAYMSNGAAGAANEPKAYYDPTATFRKWGINKPSSAPTVSASGGGGLTGDYLYAITFVNSVTGHESSISPISSSVTASGNSVALSSIPVSTDPQVNKRNIYRTTTGGAILFLLATINDNSTTTYTDNTGDADLLTDEAPLYNNPPANFKYLAVWDGRIWGAEDGSTEVRFSDNGFFVQVGLPEESFPDPNSLELFAEFRGMLQSPNFDELWIHTSKGIVKVRKTGDPEDPYELGVLGPDKYSTSSHYALVNIENEQWYIDENAKVRSVDSSGFTQYKSHLIEEALVGGTVGDKSYVGVNFTTLRTIQAVHYLAGSKNQYRFVVAESGQTTFNKMYAANYLQTTPALENDNSMRAAFAAPANYPVWESHNISSTCIGIVKDSNGVDVLYTGSTNQYVKKQDSGTNDDGSAIDWAFAVGWQRAGSTPDKTAFPWKVVAYMNASTSYTINLQIDTDFGQGGGVVYPVTLPAGGDRLDIDFKLDVSLLSAIGLKRIEQSINGDNNFLRMIWYGNALNQVLDLHSLTLLLEVLPGYR